MCPRLRGPIRRGFPRMAVFTFDMEANREKIQAFRNFIDDKDRKSVV